MQSIASVVFANLRARQIEQTLWGPTQHEHLQEIYPYEEERTKEPKHRSFRPLFLLRASRTYGNFSVCVNMSRRSPERCTPSRILRYFTRCGVAATWSVAFAIVVLAPKRAPAHAGTLLEQNLCRGDLLVRRNSS